MADYQVSSKPESRAARLFDDIFRQPRMPFKRVQASPALPSRSEREKAPIATYSKESSTGSDANENDPILERSKRRTRKKPVVQFIEPSPSPEKKKKNQKRKPKRDQERRKTTADAVLEAFQMDPHLRQLEDIDQYHLNIVTEKPGENPVKPPSTPPSEQLRKAMKAFDVSCSIFSTGNHSEGTFTRPMTRSSRRKGRTPRELKSDISFRIPDVCPEWSETDAEEGVHPQQQTRNNANSSLSSSVKTDIFVRGLRNKSKFISTPLCEEPLPNKEISRKPRPFLQPNKSLAWSVLSRNIECVLDPNAPLGTDMVASTPIEKYKKPSQWEMSSVIEPQNLSQMNSHRYSFRSQQSFDPQNSFISEHFSVDGNMSDVVPSNLSPSHVEYLSAVETPKIAFMSQDEASARRIVNAVSPQRFSSPKVVHQGLSSQESKENASSNSQKDKTEPETSTIVKRYSTRQSSGIQSNGNSTPKSSSSSSSTVRASSDLNPPYSTPTHDEFKIPDVPRRSLRASILATTKSFLLKSDQVIDPQFVHDRDQSMMPLRTPARSIVMNCTSTSAASCASRTQSILRTAQKSCRTIAFKGCHNKESVIEEGKDLACELLNFSVAFATTKVVFDDGREEVVTPRDKFLALCDPPEIVDFKQVFTRDLMKLMKKIGEGSYAEVLSTIASDGIEVVLKLIPFDPHVDFETTFAQQLPELMIGSKFSRLREGNINRTCNFIHMTRACCIQGRFPKKLIKIWNDYDKEKESENEDPRCYTADHLHLVMFLNNGGRDLESFVFDSAQQSLGIFYQTAFALAAAESEFEFEHRDLHWGNVLVKTTEEISLTYYIAGNPYQVQTGGLMASIIDFTLSRITNDGVTIYDDLGKYSDIFEGQGDLQFDIYRWMKDENKGNWEAFTPKSNIFWLHYLLDKIVNHKKYKSRSQGHRQALITLREIQKEILSFPSTKDFIESSFVAQLLNTSEPTD